MDLHKLDFGNLKNRVVSKTNQVIDSLNEPVDPDTAKIIRIKKSDMKEALQLMIDQAVIREDNELLDSIVDVRNNLNTLFPYTDVITNEERPKL